MKTTLILCLAAAFAAPASAAVRGELVDYEQGGQALQGYLAYDDALKGPRPGILVVHEWWGFGPYVKRRAEELAKLGYVAFAADMYGKGVHAATHEEAGKLMEPFQKDRVAMRARALAALDLLKKSSRVDASKLAAMGYCFGGTTALELARGEAPVRGVVSFHGGLTSPQAEKTVAVKAKVLAFVGGDDAHVMPGVPAFQDEMRKAGADWQLVVYGGAVHSFTVPEAGNDPKTGMAYNADADRRSWAAMRGFFEELFK